MVDDRELTGDEAQRALSEAMRRTRATVPDPTPAELIAFVRERVRQAFDNRAYFRRNQAYGLATDADVEHRMFSALLTGLERQQTDEQHAPSSVATGAGPDRRAETVLRDLKATMARSEQSRHFGPAACRAECLRIISEAILAAPVPLPAAAPSPCSWLLDDVGGDSEWQTSCKREFYFDGADGPTDAGFATCPFCGKPLVEQFTSEDVASSASPAKERL